MTKEEYVKAITDTRILNDPEAVSLFLVKLALYPDDQKIALIKSFVAQIGVQKLEESTAALQTIESKFAELKAAEAEKLQLEQSIIMDILQENQIGEMP